MPAEAEKAGLSYAECAEWLEEARDLCEREMSEGQVEDAEFLRPDIERELARIALARDCVRAMQAMQAARHPFRLEVQSFTEDGVTEYDARFAGRVWHNASTPHAAILAAGDEPK